MTTLRCVCGAVVEGEEEELLDAVERHLREAHPDQLDAVPEFTVEEPTADAHVGAATTDLERGEP